MCESNYGFFAAGDNSHQQLFIDSPNFSIEFVQCKNFPVDPLNIFQIIANDEKIAILDINNAIYLINGDSKLEKICFKVSLKCIQFYQNYILGLDVHGKLHVISSGKQINAPKLKMFASSNALLCGISDDNGCFELYLDGSQPKKIVDDALSVGCTGTAIFVSANDSLYKYQDEKLEKVNFDKRIVFISCSEYDALFIDENGILYQWKISKLIQIFGIPPVVFASAGIQHSAAITNDGVLYVWGFNPSFQFGSGNDKASRDPIKVATNVYTVTCAPYNTFILKLNKKPDPLPGTKHQKSNKESNFNILCWNYQSI